MEIIEKILQNYKKELFDEKTTVKFIIQFTGSGDQLNSKQIDNVSKMLRNNSRDSWIAAKGTVNGWDEWYKKRCTINLNKTQ